MASIKDGMMSPEQKELAVEWIEQRMKGKPCPICDTRNWTMDDHLVRSEVLIMKSGHTVVGGSYWAFVLLLCNTCAYSIQFNANMIGVWPPADGQTVATAGEAEDNTDG